MERKNTRFEKKEKRKFAKSATKKMNTHVAS